MKRGTYCRVHSQPAPPPKLNACFCMQERSIEALARSAKNKTSFPFEILNFSRAQTSTYPRELRALHTFDNELTSRNKYKLRKSYIALLRKPNQSSCGVLLHSNPIQDLSSLMSTVYSSKGFYIDSTLGFWCLPERRRPSPVGTPLPSPTSPANHSSCGDFEL